jgi:hypothetical protein
MTAAREPMMSREVAMGRMSGKPVPAARSRAVLTASVWYGPVRSAGGRTGAVRAGAVRAGPW